MTEPASQGPAGESTRDVPEDPLARALDSLVRDRPGLAEAAKVYGAILPLLRDSGPIAEPVALTEAEAQEKLSRGDFLLRGCTLPFHGDAARELLIRLAAVLAGAGVDGMSRIRRALEEDRLTAAELLLRVADRDYAFVAKRAEEHRLAPSLVWTLAHHALKPALRAWCRELAPLVRVEGAWEKPECYVCGSAASLGEMQGNGQSRHLRCGQCAADWPVPRMKCIYCGNENPASLAILYPDGRRDEARAEVCEACRGYLKVVARFSPCSPEELAIADLSTLFLDDYAQQQGYLRPPVRPAGH